MFGGDIADTQDGSGGRPWTGRMVWGYSLAMVDSTSKLFGSCSRCIRNGVSRGNGFKLTGVGDVVRIQPNHLSFCAVGAIDDIHGTKSKCGKLEPYVSLFQGDSGPNLFNTEYIS
jgi:hypothetical protein